MTNAIYTTIIEKIRTSLEGVDMVKEISSFPNDNVKSYPGVNFYPSELENSFETNEENKQVRGFKMDIIIGGEQKSWDDIFSTILPKVVDEVINQLASDWNAGTIEGHRTWLKVDSGDWGFFQAQNGMMAVATLNLSVKLLTNNS